MVQIRCQSPFPPSFLSFHVLLADFRGGRSCSSSKRTSCLCSPCLQVGVCQKGLGCLSFDCLQQLCCSLPFTWCFLEGKVSSANWGCWGRASPAAMGVKLPWSPCDGKISWIPLFRCMLVTSCSMEALITQPVVLCWPRAKLCST